MASRDKSRKQALKAWLAGRRPEAITEAVWNELLDSLKPISEGYLRDLLRETGLPFEQPYAGIRQGSFEELESSLREMLAAYNAAMAEEDRRKARYCRRQVIAAKDRARFVAARPTTPEPRQAEKHEMAQWMLVWLEDPGVFPAWVERRKRVLAGTTAADPDTDPAS